MSIVPFLSQTSFDPEFTGILASAFDTAWERIKSSGSPLASGAAAATTRETLARNIIAVAQTGERDHIRLIERALSQIPLDPAERRTPAGEASAL